MPRFSRYSALAATIAFNRYSAVLALVALMAFPQISRATDSAKRLYDRSELQVTEGVAAITTTAADFTAWQPMLTVTPESGYGLWDTKILIDLDKATTGFASTYTSGTITFALARKVDGTNWRVEPGTATTAISGTNSAACAIELSPGVVGPDEAVRIMMKVSAESNSNTALPFTLYYRAGTRATVTPSS